MISLLNLISRIPYYVVGAWLYVTSLLPLRLLYVFSDFLYYSSYYVIPYRKKVVRDNLHKSFPTKSTLERRQIEKKFYKHLCDLIFESLKGASISPADLKNRVEIKNPNCLIEAIGEGKGILLLSSHYANFEWMSNRVGLMLQEEYGGAKITSGLYRPFKNKAVNKMAQKYRGRWGWKLMPASRNLRNIVKLLHGGNILGIFTDQRPPKANCTFFTPFLNQLTPFLTSAAKLGLATQAKIIYVDAERISRGKYSLSFIPVETQQYKDRSDASVYALTDELASILEDILVREPAYWLWTHKRWKHKPSEGAVLSKRSQREFSIHLP